MVVAAVACGGGGSTGIVGGNTTIVGTVGTAGAGAVTAFFFASAAFFFFLLLLFFFLLLSSSLSSSLSLSLLLSLLSLTALPVPSLALLDAGSCPFPRNTRMSSFASRNAMMGAQMMMRLNGIARARRWEHGLSFSSLATCPGPFCSLDRASFNLQEGHAALTVLLNNDRDYY